MSHARHVENRETGKPMSSMPLGRKKRADEIAEHIERAISTGEFKEGAPMPSEKELADRFGVGRPSVRQALFMLQQQGLVEITSGTRARVTAPSGKFLTGQMAGLIQRLASTGQGHEHMEQTRLLFEAGIAWQAARVATDEDIARLKAALDANAAAMGNTPAFIRTDVAFHYELTVITRNPVFVAVHDALVGWLIDHQASVHFADFATSCPGGVAPAGAPAELTAQCAHASALGTRQGILMTLLFYFWAALHFLLASFGLGRQLREARELSSAPPAMTTQEA